MKIAHGCQARPINHCTQRSVRPAGTCVLRLGAVGDPEQRVQGRARVRREHSDPMAPGPVQGSVDVTHGPLAALGLAASPGRTRLLPVPGAVHAGLTAQNMEQRCHMG